MAIKFTKDRRRILTGVDYDRFRELVWDFDGRKCIYGGESITLKGMHLHHVHGRGGGKREDDIFHLVGRFKGQRACVSSCGKHHHAEHNRKVVPPKPRLEVPSAL